MLARDVYLHLIGTDGNDILTSGSGFDVLEGGNGDDTLNAGQGNDKVTGGVIVIIVKEFVFNIEL
jgi:Ca2+-binding RTX toxin-like protein